MHGAHVAVGAEIARAVAHDGTRGKNARKGLVADADEGVFFVVFEQDIIARFMRFYLRGFEDQSLLLGGGDDAV